MSDSEKFSAAKVKAMLANAKLLVAADDAKTSEIVADKSSNEPPPSVNDTRGRSVEDMLAKVKGLRAPSESTTSDKKPVDSSPPAEQSTGKQTRVLVRWIEDDILDVVWPEVVDKDVMTDACQQVMKAVGSKRLRFFLSDALQINSVSSPLSLREPCLRMLSFLSERGLEKTVGLARSQAVRLFARAVTLTTQLNLRMLATRAEALSFFDGQRPLKK